MTIRRESGRNIGCECPANGDLNNTSEPLPQRSRYLNDLEVPNRSLGIARSEEPSSSWKTESGSVRTHEYTDRLALDRFVDEIAREMATA
jgi:hypothetical protein